MQGNEQFLCSTPEELTSFGQCGSGATAGSLTIILKFRSESLPVADEH
jgi:hypothetical protein